MAVNFHQLHIFHTVAERGSFSAAAAALHMTQPAVTMQIQALEEYFGTKLFRRSTKKIELTEAGKELMVYARRSIELVKETERAMARFTHMLQGRLLLGASLTVGEYILPRLLGPFCREFPHISIRMKVMNSSQIVDEIVRRKLTFGLIESRADHAEIKTEPVLSDELRLIVPRGHPLSGRGAVAMEEVLDYPFILREPGSGTRQVMEEALKKYGVGAGDLKIVMELGSTGAVKSAVEAGLGITFLSQAAVRHELALGVLEMVAVRGVRMERQFFAVYPKSDLMPIPAATFLGFLRENDLSMWV